LISMGYNFKNFNTDLSAGSNETRIVIA